MLISLATLLAILSSIFRSRAGLQLENLAPRHQIGVLRCAAANRRLRPGGHSLRIMPSSWSPSTSSPCPLSASRSFTCFWSWPMTGAHSAFQCDRSPNRGVDGTATAGGISLCPTPALPVAAGPRCHLWQSFPRTGARYGHLRSSVCATLTLAESLCGTSDWIDSTRVPRSCDRIPGKLATANLQFVFRLLSPIENASFVGEGLPRATSDSAAGSGVRRGGTADWWANSLLRLCLQF